MNGSASDASYDRIGQGYARFRKPDPRIEARLISALADARTVVNVGAGTGSYEPTDRVVLAVEPSEQMIKQRPPDAAPCIRATAERLPVSDQSFDAALGILTIHHWSDPIGGLRELVRVARRVVLFAYEPTVHSRFWLWKEYVPAAAVVSAASELSIQQVVEVVGADRVETVLVPHDCSDGFGPAYWRRPAAYLDPDVRACISGLARLPRQDLEPGLERLRQDLDSGAWQTRHRDLLNLDAIDAGLRLIVREGRDRLPTKLAPIEHAPLPANQLHCNGIRVDAWGQLSGPSHSFGTAELTVQPDPRHFRVVSSDRARSTARR